MKKYMPPPGFKPGFFSIFYSILHKPKKLSVDIFDTYYLPKAHFLQVPTPEMYQRKIEMCKKYLQVLNITERGLTKSRGIYNVRDAKH